MTQLNFLKSKVARTLTNELDNLQLERDTLLKQTEFMKNKLIEQTQEYDNTLNKYRTSLNSFRLVSIELEQQIKEQTDNELLHLKPYNQASHDDAHKLMLILENKIDEKKLVNIQLQKTVDDYQENILKEKQSLIKRENDYIKMDHMEEELKININVKIFLIKLIFFETNKVKIHQVLFNSN